MGLTAMELQRPPALVLQKSNRVKTVEGRSRLKPGTMDINQIEAQRQQNNASRLTGGKKFSAFTHDENQNSENCMSPNGIANGLMPEGNVMSAKDSDRSSIMDIPEQNDDLPSAYDVQKNREL